VAVLREGVQEWNEWRRAHPEVQPDLTGVSSWDIAPRLPRRLPGTFAQFVPTRDLF
jgi:hypothetical protein